MGLVFRSVGYRGVPIPGVPFHDAWGVILNDKGRVLEPDSREPQVGEYAAGWIKRGPSGVIGTNKPDAAETVACMAEDAGRGRLLAPAEPDAAAVLALVAAAPASVDLVGRLAADRRARGRAGPRVRPAAGEVHARRRDARGAGPLSPSFRGSPGIPGGRRTGSPYGCSR